MSRRERNVVTPPERQETSRRSSVQPPPEIVARRAYQIWQSHGCPEGTAADDWRQAESELRRASLFRSGRCETKRHWQRAGSDSIIDEASEESFPASDPPAWTHCGLA